uniref:RING-type E3 ubiquitin transferase n=2 Tax=Populus canescens TaxID=80863 RepID=Q5ICP0_POPCN|nr:RING-H2 subgroup RHE protein [Populus tremula x Populus alba]
MDPDSRDPPIEYREGYALSGKIMLSAILILFFVIIVMVLLHLYARWYLTRARQRQVRRVRNRRTHLVFYVDSPQNPNNVTSHVTRGLEETVKNSLPVFVYPRKTHQDSIECAVCLSEFEENERGRVLPKCNHSFHTECIDMWFHSHSTCPLCRSPVEPVAENPVPEGSNFGISEAGSGLCTSCQHEEDHLGSASTSSFNGGRKPVGLIGVTIDVPRRNGNFEDESNTESPSASHSFRSPMSRMLSFKRMLSRERRGTVSPTVANSVSCGGGSGTTEFDIEQGRDESMPQQTRC